MDRLAEIAGYSLGWIAGAFIIGLIPAWIIYLIVTKIAQRQISGRECVIIGWCIVMALSLVGWFYRYHMQN